MRLAHTWHSRCQAVQDPRLALRALYVVNHLKLFLLLRRPEMPKQELTWEQTPGEEKKGSESFHNTLSHLH